MSIKKELEYYLWATNRRRLLDELQKKYEHIYHGVVLDVGGRDRGRFKKPKKSVEQWVFIDIEAEHQPDMVLDVAKMTKIKNDSIDVINAIELFEHVEKIDEGIKECHRVLKKGGFFIISMPFLYAIHGDPHDFQRWTEFKWRTELSKHQFKIVHFEIMGRYFFVLSENLKYLLNQAPLILGINKLLKLCFYPLLHAMAGLDQFLFVTNNKILGNFHGGYFIVAEKQ